MKKIKDKIAEAMVKREAKKLLGDGPKELQEKDEENVDPESDNTSTLGDKIKAKFRKLKKTRTKSPGAGVGSDSDGNETDADKKGESTDTAVETSDGSGTTEEVATVYSTPSSQQGSEWDTDSEAGLDRHLKDKGEGKDLDESRELLKPGESLIPDDKKTNFKISVHIFDGSALQGFEGQELNPMVRVQLDQKQRKTRVIRGTDTPTWDQTMEFTIKAAPGDLCEKSLVFKVYSSNSLVRVPLIGSFKYGLSYIFKKPNHRAINQFVPLRGGGDEDEGDPTGHIRGFLRLSVAITYPGYNGPIGLKGVKSASLEMINSAELLQYRLVFRVYKLFSVMRKVRYPNDKTPEAPVEFCVEVTLNGKSVKSEYRFAHDENLAFHEELMLPMLWPTVAKNIRIRILSRIKKKKFRKDRIAVVCTAFLEFKQLCQSGENGYLPVFGPGFVNFFGPDMNLNLSKKNIKLARNEGTGAITFYGRLLCDLVCSEGKINDATNRELTLAVIKSSESYYVQKQYMLAASLYIANSIDPEYKSENVQFAVSIGQFGNPEYDYALKCTDRTLPTMPIYDYTRYYAMPWGNQKPICEVHCSWEDISQRIAQASCILKISQSLKKNKEVAELQAAINSDTFSTASIVISALEEAIEGVKWLVKNAVYQVNESMKLTKLDIHLQTSRFLKFERIQTKCEEFKYLPLASEDVNDLALKLLEDIARELDELVLDPQISIPDVLVLMLVNNFPVAYARVPIAEIAFNSVNEMKNGAECGKLKAFKLEWLNRKEKMADEIPATLHARFWFGLSSFREYWEKMLEPGKVKYFAEIFVNESKGLMGKFDACEFKEMSKAKTIYAALSCQSPYHVSDQTGAIEMSEESVRPPVGWKFKGSWKHVPSHQMYVGPETGKKVFEDEVFEVEQKLDDEWKFWQYTDDDGDEIEKATQAPLGWIYDTEWEVDLYGETGVDGWVYSIADKFSDKLGAVDINERPSHTFRRRRWKRLRVLDERKGDIYRMYEDPKLFRQRCDAAGWEYAKAFDRLMHMQQESGDKFRRKRMLREIVRTDNAACKLNVRIDQKKGASDKLLFISPRIYEVHEECCQFQLRVYILWARELYCSNRVITRSFVRVFWMQRCLETAVIKHTSNPIYNETLVFKEMLTPGGMQKLKENPPFIVVEIIGETIEGLNIVLGRFYVSPTVVDLQTKSLANCKWHRLENARGDTNGALLFYSELYRCDGKYYHRLPKLPSFKPNCGTRYEVPRIYRPVFIPYTFQIVCYGLRNLQRYQMTAIRQPWLEVTVGDSTARTMPLKDAKINPNFECPVITFEKIMMPDNLYFAPPIQILLFDQRAFGMQPQIGVCTISNFKRFERQPQNAPTIVPEDWVEFDSLAKIEREDEALQLIKFDEAKGQEAECFLVDPDDPNSPRIDWWCKYYHSCGENQKAPGFDRLSLGKMALFKTPLEDVGDYRGFGDFMDTFKMLKSSRKKGRFGKSTDTCGELKGKLFINRENKDKPNLLYDIPGVEFDGTVPCIVRVYIICGIGIVAEKKKGTLDLQVNVSIGSRKRTTAYVPDSSDPIFGEVIEMEATIPVDSILKIKLQDKKRLFGVDDIGETVINLEDRLYTKHRATVGLPSHYNLFGPLPWRDQLPPLDILSRYCKKMRLPVPKVLRKEAAAGVAADVGIIILSTEIWLSQVEKDVFFNKSNQAFMGKPLQRLALFILHGIGVVPEHVETRPLFSVINPDLEIGKLECFVDIIPLSIGAIPPSVNVTKRKPISYQLRCVIWKTRNVIPVKKSFGKPASDLFVECYLNGSLKTERTDIHYRVLDGAASFNWRFVFDFEYDPWEKKICAKKKKRFLRKDSYQTVDPLLVIRVLDNNKFKKDGFIGELVLPLLGFEEGQMNEDEMVNVYYPQDKKYKCCVQCCRLCWSTKCCLKKAKQKEVKLPRAPVYIGGDIGIHSLFSSKSVRGWWPCLNNQVSPEQKMDMARLKKKYDDIDLNNVKYVTGMVEVELSLLTKEDADKEPVGKKRKKPNKNPFLGKPDRPKFDNYWCTSRCRAGSKFCWKKCGPQCLCITCCVLSLVLVIAALIWQAPQIITLIATKILHL